VRRLRRRLLRPVTSSWICSRLRPIVSGTRQMKKITAQTAMAA
jgi:hypothetical protein